MPDPEVTVNAPSAGADIATATVEAPPPSADTANLSDDEILDKQYAEAGDPGDEDDGQAAGAEPGEGDDAKTAAEAGAKQDGAKEEPEAQIPEPKQYKEVFKAHPELRTAYYTGLAYREVFPTVAEAREVRTLYPTVEDAKLASESHQALSRFDDLFYSESPEDHQAFLTTLHEEDPEKFKSVSREFPTVQYKLDPEGYKADTRERVQGVLANLEQRAQASQNQNLVNAVAVISRELLGTPSAARAAATDPREQNLAAREQRVQNQERQQQQGEFARFHGATSQAAEQAVKGAVTAKVNEALKSAAISEAAKSRIIADIVQDIDNTLEADRTFKATLRREFRSGSRDEAHQKRILARIEARVKALVPQSATKHINQWTKDILGTNKERLASQRAQAGRQDISGAGGGSRPSGPSKLPPSSQIDYAKTSDDDLLDAALTGKADRVAVRR